MRKHFGGEPAQLSDAAFAQLAGEAVWLEDFRADKLEAAMASAMAKVLEAAFGKA